MKKTYINPTLEVVKIASHSQMMAGSTLSKQGDFGDAVTDGGTATEGFTLNGREFTFGEDDEY